VSPLTQKAPIESLQGIIAALEKAQKLRFADLFLETWSSNGFGSLSKRDTDLLVVMCIIALSGDGSPTTDIGWAQLFKVAPARARSLRLDAFMRFGHQFADLLNANRARRMFRGLRGIELDIAGQSIEISKTKLRFLIEDPVAQMELEAEAAAVDGFIDYLNNRRVIEVSLSTFLKILKRFAPDVEDSFISKVEAKTALDGVSATELRAKLEAKSYASKSETGKLLAFVDVLGDVVDSKPSSLLRHLKLIFKSQTETSI